VAKKVKADSYFLSEKCPFSGRRKPNWKRIKLFSALGLVLLVVGLLFVGPTSSKTTAAAASTSIKSGASQPPTSGGDSDYLQRQSISDGYGVSRGAGRTPRQYNASQLVRRGDGSNGDRLPLGSTILARLVNSVLSTDSNSPVIAEIPEDILWKNTVIIPVGTRAIGQATLDDSTQRLQARFQTLVFPEGDQHAISAIGLMGDGSSGIAGDYHSRTFEKQGGRFFGNFVGGLAEGMKDRKSAGSQNGIVFEPGSLKNGLLNGLAASSFDQAKVFSDNAQNLRTYLDVKAGTVFVLYLEKEFGL
jgi:hypothetical protein